MAWVTAIPFHTLRVYVDCSNPHHSVCGKDLDFPIQPMGRKKRPQHWTLPLQCWRNFDPKFYKVNISSIHRNPRPNCTARRMPWIPRITEMPLPCIKEFTMSWWSDWPWRNAQDFHGDLGVPDKVIIPGAKTLLNTSQYYRNHQQSFFAILCILQTTEFWGPRSAWDGADRRSEIWEDDLRNHW